MARRAAATIAPPEEESYGNQSSLAAEENSALYAALKQRRREIRKNATATVSDKAIYDAITRRAEFPRLAKQLAEEMRNRSIAPSSAFAADGSLNITDFAPSTLLSPGDVITSALRALQDDGELDDGSVTSSGVEIFLRFVSPAATFAEMADDPDALATYFSRSEYKALLNWDRVVYTTPIDVSVDGNKAFQITQLRERKTGDVHKVKWYLSRNKPANARKRTLVADDTNLNNDGVWLIDAVIVAKGRSLGSGS